MKISPGKLQGMKAVSDDRGVIAAAAMDQRGSLKKALAKERGSDVTDKDLEEFKIIVTEVLTQHACSIPSGAFRPASGAQKRPGCSWRTRRRATTRTRQAVCRTCSISGRSGG